MKRLISRKAFVFYSVFFAIALLAWWVSEEQLLSQTLLRVERMEHWEAFALFALYIPAAILFVPVFIISLAAGYLLGFKAAFIVILAGSTAGSMVAFALARTVAREFVEEKIARHPKFQAVDRAVSGQGFKIVTLSRIAPILSYNLLNYMYAVSRVSFKEYFWGTWIGMLPASLMLALLGASAKGVPDILAAPRAGLAQHPTFLIVAALLTVGILFIMARMVMRTLKQSGLERAPVREFDLS
jgi:uncharacterized membrane protein YdjX (TVP38/TMEM64 family)